MKNILITAILSVLFFLNLSAQNFDLSAEMRPRFEGRHGYKSLATKDVDGGNFISQRTRLNFKFDNKKVAVGLVMQNVRVWGDVSTLAANVPSNSFHEAWAQYQIMDNVALKMGRQEIIYDDHRIFGNVGWAQQARSHDAFLIKYAKDKHKLDVGFAMNADAQANVDNLYSNAAGYKSMQYAWYHGAFNDFGLSFLLLNTGVEYQGDDQKQTVDFMQTIGPRMTYKAGKLNANAAVYFQSGKKTNLDVSALYYALNLGYKLNDNFNLAAGIEYLSGKDQDDAETGIKSFAPLFGTNHKFNGWMDYFYVGNHFNSVGLTDINFTLGYKKNKFYAKAVPHIFSSAAKVVGVNGELDKALGTEIDLTLGYKFSKAVKFSAGYSQMFATETMEALKAGSKDETSNWGWIMFTFKPGLFSYHAPEM